jgi:hypothetical protein
VYTLSSAIAIIASSTQGRFLTLYSPQHTSLIGRVGAAHSFRFSISHRDIQIRRPDSKAQNRFLTVYSIQHP